MKKLILPALILFFFATAPAQVVINEICPANNSLLIDEDGDSPDWIELYNSGGTAVNIAGYRITDNISNPDKWIFPSGVSIPANGFLLLFASGKDRSLFFNHWETVVNAGDTWKYTKPLMEPDSNWRRLPSFNDGAWSSGPGGIGYGDGDDVSIISQPATSVFLRKVFTVVDTADIASAVLHIDYDDAFVAYINGVEIARSNIGVNGSPTPFSATAFNEHEAKMYSGGMPDRFVISEAVLKTFLVNGTNVLAIQVHNVDPWSSDMTALPWLSFGIKSSATNYGPVPIWFNLNASSLHTNFSLAQNGETLSLISPGGSLLSQRTYQDVLPDNSYGCQIDGSLAQRYFRDPTPGVSNNTAAGFTDYTEDPQFTPDAGFYSTSQSVSITSATVGAEIRYTTDGSDPGPTSGLYAGPINVDSTIVIKARCFHSTLLEGNIMTNSYFIADSTSASLPVISLSVDPVLMFDTVTGAYTKGPNADAGIPFFGANFWQELEIPAYIEFFDKSRQQGFEQGIGIEIYGNYSRSYPQKSMKIIARDAYGDGSISYQLFSGKDIHSFKQFIIRNAGTDWNSAHMRDALVHSLVMKTTDNDVMAVQPAVVFINGQYWGVYNMREKINKFYINNNHDIDKDSIDILQYNGLVMEGSNEQFLQMGWNILLSDMSDPGNFAYADSLIDLENFTDYFAVETWSNNWDWLTNNVRYWRDQRPGGQWRYILWDLDNGLGGAWSYVVNSLDTNIHKPLDYTSLLFNKLLENVGFKNYFINRYADLLNTALTPDKFNARLFSMRDSVDAEMPRHFQRWGTGFSNPNWGVNGHGSYADWRNYQLHELEFFSANRQITARNHLQETFVLKKQVPVTLNVQPPEAGEIHINTVTIDEFPWAGIYFDSVAVTITAIPKPGYTFGFWQSGIFVPLPDTSISLSFVPDTADVFTAYFYGAPDTSRVVFSEINYRSYEFSDAGDWVELYNPSAWPLDLSGWKFKDADDANIFVIPENTVLNAGSYLVLAADLNKFAAIYPTVSNVIGEFNFGLNSVAESIRLIDQDMNEYVRIDFTSSTPWSTEVNGSERTLELLDADGTQNDPANWFAGCPLGSPGGPFVPCANDLEELQSESRDGEVAVYPNPVSDQLHIDINPKLLRDHELSLTIFNLSGSPVYSINHIDKDELLIDNTFAPGMYFYRIIGSDSFIKSGKVVFR